MDFKSSPVGCHSPAQKLCRGRLCESRKVPKETSRGYKPRAKRSSNVLNALRYI
ncbi:MAG: hypothetical protein ACYCTB_01485 [bacterium]